MSENLVLFHLLEENSLETVSATELSLTGEADMTGPGRLFAP